MWGNRFEIKFLAAQQRSIAEIFYVLKKEYLKFTKSVPLFRSIRIYGNFQQFSLNVAFKENAYYREIEKTFSIHITLNRYLNLKDFRDQVSD